MRIHSVKILVLVLATCGILACETDTGSSTAPDTTLEYGFPKNTGFACSNANILDALVKVCNYFASCSKTEICNRTTQELFAGVTLKSVTNPASTYWNEFGGRGEVIANASLCMLKELSKGSVTNEATAKLFEVFPVKVKQTLGFLHYDAIARRMDGYQTVSICLPLVGCFDAKEQTFGAVIKKRSPAHPLNQSCGNFPVKDAYALQVTAEESEQTLNAKVPDINISTPYGPIVVQPEFKYYSDLHAILFPLDDTYAQYYPERNVMRIYDTYGRIPGTSTSVAPRRLTPAGAPYDTGWISQIGLGSRQPDPASELWARDPDYPFRPDFDLSKARSEKERKPVAGMEALAKITYTPPLPEVLNEAPLKTTLDLFVTPVVSARFASQFDIFFNEFTNSLMDVGNTLRISAIQMESRADANAAFAVEAGLNLNIKFTAFLTKTLVDTHPKTKFTIASNNDAQQKNVGNAQSGSDPRFDSTVQLQSYSSSASGAQNSPTPYVNDCVAQPVPDQPKPVATFTPGDPSILKHTQYPCNICVGHEAHTEGSTYVSKFSTLVTPTAGGPKDWSCNEYHSGCFDMCSFNAETGSLTITKTAIQMGLRGMPRNLACNEKPVQ